MDTPALAALVVGLLDDAYLSDVLVRLLRTPTDVAVRATPGEPGDLRLARHAVRGDQALLLVGAGNQIALDHPGRLAVEITIRGHAAHSSRPDLALSAIDGAARALARLGASGGALAPPALGASEATVARL